MKCRENNIDVTQLFVVSSEDCESRNSYTHHQDVGSSVSNMDPADALLPSDGGRDTDGEMGLAVAEPGRLWVFSMTGEVPPPLPWLSTESVDEEDRVRRMYGLGGGFLDSSETGDVDSGGGTPSAANSSTSRGGGRSTMASSS